MGSVKDDTLTLNSRPIAHVQIYQNTDERISSMKFIKKHCSMECEFFLKEINLFWLLRLICIYVKNLFCTDSQCTSREVIGTIASMLTTS